MLEIQARLDELTSLGLRRRTRLVSGPQGPRVLLDGRPVLLLCSENYLGLADHPRVREAAAQAAMRWGVGAGGARTLSGTMTIHRRLERRLADFSGTRAALLFGSGHLANIGIVAALARPGDVVFADAGSHQSIIDGCRLSGAELFAYEHRDTEHLRWGIEQAEGRGALVVTDGLFAFDGELAPLAEIVELAKRFGLRTVVDDTHGFGALGPGGRGSAAAAQVSDRIDVIVGSLATSLGSYGAFAACEEPMARYLSDAAGTFACSSAPAPPTVAAALAALELLICEPRRVRRLQRNAEVLRGALVAERLRAGGTGTQIVPLTLGDGDSAQKLCEAALQRGVFAQALRAPALPDVGAGLRLTVIATHRDRELREAAQTIAAAARAVGVDLGRAPTALDTRLSAVTGRPDPGSPSTIVTQPARRVVFDGDAAPVPRAA